MMRQKNFSKILALLLVWLVFCNLDSPQESIKKGFERITEPIVSRLGIYHHDPVNYIVDMDKAYNKVTDYTSIFRRRETRGGKLQKEEVIWLEFEKPFSIRMKWIDGPNKGRDIFYVEGKNEGKMLAKPGGIAGVFISYVHIDVDGVLARSSSSRSIKEAGLGNTIASIIEQTFLAKERGDLEIIDHGKDKLEGRTVRFIERVLPQMPIYQNHRLLIWIDENMGLPLKIMLYNWDNVLTEVYQYSDLRTNVNLTDNDFIPSKAKKDRWRASQEAIERQKKRRFVRKDEDIEKAQKIINAGLREYAKIQDYSTTFVRQERIKDTLLPEEKIFIKFKKPFSVYWKLLAGNALYSELIYDKGKNDNKVMVHPSGTVGYLLQKAAVNPNGKWAMKGNRHPITEFGIGFFLDRYKRDFEQGVSSGDFWVSCKGPVVVNGEESDEIELVLTNKPKIDQYYAPKCIVAFSRKSKLPIDIQIFNESGEIVEWYEYFDLRVNNGFTDTDFDPRNPAYGF